MLKIKVSRRRRFKYCMTSFVVVNKKKKKLYISKNTILGFLVLKTPALNL